MKPEQDVLSTLRALRRRLSAQSLASRLAHAGLLAAGLLVALAVVERWSGRALWSGSAVLLAGVAAVLWAAGAAWRARPSMATAASVIDRAAATRDRFTTALEFTTQSGQEARGLALRECAAYVRGREFAPHLPWRLPREVRWLWVPLVAVALLRWDAGMTAARRAAETAAATRAMAPTVSELQKLAQAIEKSGDQAGSEEMKRLAEELRRSVERLRADAKSSGDAQKSSLRELSALEDLVRQMQEQRRAQFTPEELKALAQALRENEATEEAGRQLEQGQPVASAESLEKKADELAAKGDERTAEEITKALKAALERVAQQQPLSPSARQAAQPGGASSEALRKLAQLLRQTPGKQGAAPGQAAQQLSPQALQKLLTALEDLKQGEGKAARPGPPTGGESQILMQAFDRRNADEQKGDRNMVPTGQPGGEHDQGTTQSAFGGKPNPATAKGADLALSGLAGVGETASQLLPGATSDDSKARRKYKELYDAMAPAAEDAVQQENIPLGSRYFVKRYFEAIRPKE